MKVYVVQNNDNILLGVFSTKKKAERFMEDIGIERWQESWVLTPWKLDELQERFILSGSEDFLSLMARKESARKRRDERNGKVQP